MQPPNTHQRATAAGTVLRRDKACVSNATKVASTMMRIAVAVNADGANFQDKTMAAKASTK
jgi:hypothetical protein